MSPELKRRDILRSPEEVGNAAAKRYFEVTYETCVATEFKFVVVPSSEDHDEQHKHFLKALGMELSDLPFDLHSSNESLSNNGSNTSGENDFVIDHISPETPLFLKVYSQDKRPHTLIYSANSTGNSQSN